MMGRILEVSGAAEKMAFSFIKFLGEKKEEWALAITGYIVSIPIFVDSAFVVLYPVAKALAKNSKRSLLTLGVALAGGLVVTHHTVPPTPGPLGVGIFGVALGAMLLSGMCFAVPCVLGMVLYAQWLAKRYPDFNREAFSDDELRDKLDTYIEQQEAKKLPSLFLSLLPIVLPIALIFIKAIVDIVAKTTMTDEAALQAFQAGGLYQTVAFIGHPIVALAISVLIAVYTLLPKTSARETAIYLEEGVTSAGIILLVTGAGGALGAILRDSGAGKELAEHIANHLPFSPIMIPFIVATLMRFIQGSGTVAMIAGASISMPILAEIEGINMLLAANAATMGSLFFGYFNDSLFWVVNRMMGIAEVKTQMIVWSIPTTIAWGIGGALVALVNLVFGKGGSIVDPLLPLVILGLVMAYVMHMNRQLNAK